jgi:hypothetical protein
VAAAVALIVGALFAVAMRRRFGKRAPQLRPEDVAPR